MIGGLPNFSRESPSNNPNREGNTLAARELEGAGSELLPSVDLDVWGWATAAAIHNWSFNNPTSSARASWTFVFNQRWSSSIICRFSTAACGLTRSATCWVEEI